MVLERPPDLMNGNESCAALDEDREHGVEGIGIGEGDLASLACAPKGARLATNLGLEVLAHVLRDDFDLTDRNLQYLGQGSELGESAWFRIPTLSQSCSTSGRM